MRPDLRYIAVKRLFSVVVGSSISKNGRPELFKQHSRASAGQGSHGMSHNASFCHTQRSIGNVSI